MALESTTTDNVLSTNHKCIGTYEDKPTNCIYYFVSFSGAKEYDSILEYNLIDDKVRTVYQDGRMLSDGSFNGVLKFSRNEAITGVNKIDDILYWTDNLNRPRKINVRLGKQNEYNISNASQYLDFYYKNNYSTVFITADNSHGFKDGDYIYTHANSADLTAYNGYAEVTGIVKKMPANVTFNITADSFSVTSSVALSNGQLNVGEFIGVIHSNFPYFFKVGAKNGTSITLEGEAPSFTNNAALSLYLLGSEDTTSMAGVITNCPWAYSASMTDSSGNPLYGVILNAKPDNAYSPLISFGKSTDRSKYLDVVKHQPTKRPITELKNDSTIAKNDILDNLFQFKYRYDHQDNESSSYSGISDIQIDPEFALNVPLTHNNYRTTNNVVDVEYFDTISDVKKIEIVARKGNEGEFILVDTVENNFITYLRILKNELIPDSNYHFIISKSLINFKNNGIYPFIDRVDSDKLFDAVPKLAKAQTILSNNRLAYGNILEGYDNTPLVASSTFSGTGNIVQSLSSSLNFYANGNFSTLVPSTESGGNGSNTVMALAIQNETGGSKWNSDGGENCDWNVYLNFNGLDLNEEKSQTISINIRWGLKRRSNAASLQGSDVKSRAGRLDMKVDVSGLTSISAVISKVIQAFNSDDWDGGTITTLSHDSGGSNPDNATKDEGSITLSTTSSNGILISFHCIDNSEEPDGSGSTFWAVTNSGWKKVSHSHVAKFTSGSPGFNSFKRGAFHDFGVAYFDETNRCSFVNISPKYIDSNYSGSRAYNAFVTEDDEVGLSESSKVQVEIYNRPPVWATHYQMCYSGNNTVGDFMQITSPLSKPGEDGDSQIYIGLQALKGHKSSYNEASGSDLDFEFLEKGGDRIRFISCEHNGIRKKFNEYLDFKITGFDFYQAEGEDLPISLSSGQEGFYIRINNPGSSNVLLEDGESVSIGHSGFSYASSGFNKLIAEVYREKKTTSDESMIYYEVGSKLEINNAGNKYSATHVGNISDQDSNFSFNEESGVDVSGIPAVVEISSGDVYLKPREMFTSISGDELQNLENFVCEDYYLNDFHNTNHWSRGRINVINNNSKERRLNASVYYSETYSSTNSVNGLSNFNLANAPYFDYNKDFGSIQSLKMRDNDLIIFHESKVGRVLVGKDILNTASGEGLVSLSNNIIANYVNTYSNPFGCGLNPESIVEHGGKFYFTDIKKGAVLRLSADGVTVISDNGMKDYFRDLGEMYIKYNPDYLGSGESLYEIASESGKISPYLLVGGYDPKYDEYVITFPEIKALRGSGDEYVVESEWGSDIINWENVTQAYNSSDSDVLFNAVTLSFSEGQNKWVSFYSFIPEFYSKINKQFVSFKGGRTYRHNNSDIYSRNTLSKSEMNNFYGNGHLSYLDFVFNAVPSSVKTYNAISLESDTKFLTGLFSNMGQHYGNYNDVISTSIAFKKIDGVVSAKGGNPETNMIIGTNTEFYKDIRPGDLVRIFGLQNSQLIYKDFIATKIHSNTILEINDPLNYSLDGDLFVPHNNLMYSIDYKTKEGIQYASIPFCTSGSSNSGSQLGFGDGSEIISVGRGRLFFNSNCLAIENSSFNPSTIESAIRSRSITDITVGGSYVFTGEGISVGNPNGVPVLSQFSNVSEEAVAGLVFTCVSTPPVNLCKVLSTDLRLYAKDVNGETFFLGYPKSITNNGLTWVAPDDSYSGDIPDNSFLYIVLKGKVEGEKMKGSYMRTILATNKNQSKSKFNLYAANADVDKSELSGNKQ